MHCTILQHLNKNLSVRYGEVDVTDTQDITHITFVKIHENDIKAIQNLHHNVQSELNRILKKYVNVL